MKIKTKPMKLRSFPVHAWKQAQTKLDRLGSNSEGTALKINIDKTKVLRLNARRLDRTMINGTDVEDTDSFVYLEAVVNNLGGAEEPGYSQY